MNPLDDIRPGDLCYDSDDDLVLILKIDGTKIDVVSALDSNWRWSIWHNHEKKERGEKCLTKVV